jgi:hypothetical protein
MSDFLASLNRKYMGDDLLRLIKKPYGSHAPVGRSFDFPWGKVTMLEEHLANNKNIIAKNGDILA